MEKKSLTLSRCIVGLKSYIYVIKILVLSRSHLDFKLNKENLSKPNWTTETLDNKSTESALTCAQFSFLGVQLSYVWYPVTHLSHGKKQANAEETKARARVASVWAQDQGASQKGIPIKWLWTPM